MKPYNRLYFITMLAGLIGHLLHKMQWASAYDKETELFRPGAPMTFLLFGFLALSAVFVLLGTRSLKLPAPGPRCCLSFEPAAPTLYKVLMAASGIFFLVGGVFGLLQGYRQLQEWRYDPSSMLLTLPMAVLICSVLCFPAGLSTLLLCKNNTRGVESPYNSLFVVFPPLVGVVFLFATHMEHATDPVLMGYGMELAAIMLLTIALYDMAGMYHNNPHPRRMLLCSLLGYILGASSEFPSGSVLQIAVMAALIFSVYAQSFAYFAPQSSPSQAAEEI